MKRNGHYWTEAEKAALPVTNSFSGLSKIALAVLSRMPRPTVQVCGPISTGGLGSVEKNLEVFDATINHLIRQGLTVFDQVPFEDHFFRIEKQYRGTPDQLLVEFYLPIFESGHISSLHFIHGWQSSKGANWEHEQAKRLGIEIVYLEPNLVSI